MAQIVMLMLPWDAAEPLAADVDPPTEANCWKSCCNEA